ncbi:hypothetical protein ADUPG1_014238 [Aduncisulcus paluster]|uniref:Uncharacterized protein n=1 Tax=Aduncisulcus paluster TaxID=2918883 RepID=A0ABQ5KBD1_9EUKA|nr:hypothetical protein ADUPG1_014238 [Aduncisulcus paluster]
MESFKDTLKEIVKKLPESFGELEDLRKSLKEVETKSWEESQVKGVFSALDSEIIPFVGELICSLNEDSVPGPLSEEELAFWKKELMKNAAQAFSGSEIVKIPRRPESLKNLIYSILSTIFSHPYFRLDIEQVKTAVLVTVLPSIEQKACETVGIPANPAERQGLSPEKWGSFGTAIRRGTNDFFKVNPWTAQTIKAYFCSKLLFICLEQEDQVLLSDESMFSNFARSLVETLLSIPLYNSRTILRDLFTPLVERFVFGASSLSITDSKTLSALQSFSLYCLGAVDRWVLSESDLLVRSFSGITKIVDEYKDDVVAAKEESFTKDTFPINLLFAFLLIFIRSAYSVGRVDDVALALKDHLGVDFGKLLDPIKQENPLVEALSAKFSAVIDLCTPVLHKLSSNRRFIFYDQDVLLGKKTREQVEQDEERFQQKLEERKRKAEQKAEEETPVESEDLEVKPEDEVKTETTSDKESESAAKEESELKKEEEGKEEQPLKELTEEEKEQLSVLRVQIRELSVYVGHLNDVIKLSNSLTQSSPSLPPFTTIASFYIFKAEGGINGMWKAMHSRHRKGWFQCVYSGMHKVRQSENFMKNKRESEKKKSEQGKRRASRHSSKDGRGMKDDFKRRSGPRSFMGRSRPSSRDSSRSRGRGRRFQGRK